MGDPLRFEYGRVRVSGKFLHDKEFYLAARSLKEAETELEKLGVSVKGKIALRTYKN